MGVVFESVAFLGGVRGGGERGGKGGCGVYSAVRFDVSHQSSLRLLDFASADRHERLDELTMWVRT